MKFQDKFYPATLQNTLEDFRLGDFLCDVRLVVDGHEFQAHKVILAAASPYFRGMFNSESLFVESQQAKVQLHGIDRNAMSHILKFIYSSDIDITDDNVYELMEAANLFQIYALRTFISVYLQCSLTVENCLQSYLMAKFHDYHDLAAYSFHFLLENFSKIIEKDEFYCVPSGVMFQIVSSKLVDVCNEEMLLEVILKWVNLDVKSRFQYLDSLISNINLNLFPIESLHKIKNNESITTRVVQKIDEIINTKMSRGLVTHIIDSEKRYNFHKFRHKAETIVIFAIGGESSGKASQGVECFTSGFDKWRYIVPEYIVKGHETQNTNVLPPLRCARYYAASAHDSYKVYVMGGRNSTTLLDECEVFDVKTNQWNYFQQLPEKLYASSAAFLEGELIVVGGCNEEGISGKVWKLNKIQNVWTLMPPLNISRYFHGTITSGGYIYVFGGYDSKTQAALKTCVKFDPGSNKWLQISGMHQARAKFGCAAFDNFIYVFGGTSDESNCLKTVERYNTFTDEWTFETSMTIPRHSFSVAVSDHEIYCMGGSDSTHFLDSVEKFSLRTKRWHYVHSLQISRLGPAAAALAVPYFAGVNRDVD